MKDNGGNRAGFQDRVSRLVTPVRLYFATSTSALSAWAEQVRWRFASLHTLA